MKLLSFAFYAALNGNDIITYTSLANNFAKTQYNIYERNSLFLSEELLLISS